VAISLALGEDIEAVEAAVLNPLPFIRFG